MELTYDKEYAQKTQAWKLDIEEAYEPPPLQRRTKFYCFIILK